MSDFVQQCRREWERLGVPDSVANEMAADLAADLAEAQDEGVSAEEVLGTGVFDARSFALSWAAERGVIPSAPHPQQSASRKPAILVGLATFTVIGLIGAVLIALRVHESVAVARPTRLRFAPPAQPDAVIVHGAPGAAEAIPWILVLVVALLAAAVVAWLWSRWGRSRPPTKPA
ncbi:MAG TPA: hypothetical protein VH817_13935 [Thermoleophilaceae bacterium]|jgi:hypothetical protein